MRWAAETPEDQCCVQCCTPVQGVKLCLACSPEGTMFKRPQGVKQFVPDRDKEDPEYWE